LIAIAILKLLDAALHHEVEPEKVHKAEYYEERGAHSNHVKVERLPLPVVRLFNNAHYNVNWEEPEAEVHPGRCHQEIAR
jgi:hypothetical protein